MPEPESLLDAEFDAQLRGLFAQAEKAIESRAGTPSSTAESTPSATPPVDASDRAEPAPPATPPEPAPTAAPPRQLSLPQLLKPIALGLESVSRATGENTAALKNFEASSAEATEAQKQLPGVIVELRTMLDAKNAISQSMFAALHRELKEYKDGFLLDSVHRPVIRDLISLYDDVAGIQSQVAIALKTAADANLCTSGLELIEKLRTVELNIEHHLGFITEVLNRLEVTLMPPHEGKLDKQTQRAVAVELAEDPDEDGMVVRTVKRGFLWKDRLFRAEEVIIKKWKEGFLVALAPQEQK